MMRCLSLWRSGPVRRGFHSVCSQPAVRSRSLAFAPSLAPSLSLSPSHPPSLWVSLWVSLCLSPSLSLLPVPPSRRPSHRRKSVVVNHRHFDPQPLHTQRTTTHTLSQHRPTTTAARSCAGPPRWHCRRPRSCWSSWRPPCARAPPLRPSSTTRAAGRTRCATSRAREGAAGAMGEVVVVVGGGGWLLHTGHVESCVRVRVCVCRVRCPCGRASWGSMHSFFLSCSFHPLVSQSVSQEVTHPVAHSRLTGAKHSCGPVRSTLLLIDLAGSERNEDSRTCVWWLDDVGCRRHD